MIIDISGSTFKHILSDERLALPIRWDGSDFSLTLGALFNSYIKKLESLTNEKNPYSNCIRLDVSNIKKTCGLLTRTLNHYLNGFPSKAYGTFEQVMRRLMEQPLNVYHKSIVEQFKRSDSYYDRDGGLQLFRVARVDDNRPYKRVRVFHTPYNLRSKVSTSRYSIAGYPSLYLGTSLNLCCEEIHLNLHQDFALASLFKLERDREYTNTNIRVIELGIKPQDFVEIESNNKRHTYRQLLEGEGVRAAYLLWYPLIAACSYIRTNKKDPFAAEYIIPQLLMQWVRSEISANKDDEYDQLIGIRYFSCASVKASDMGFNYVFPTSGQHKSANLPYCPVLAKSFSLTKPVYIHEYDTIYECEQHLRHLGEYDFINAK
ncbi:hypothetical protein NE619_10370 [Anaerovorax odorimutans]|uniref:RES domain-containing protein n=1 Tax=Anaerovorax odorimutans TaxID=109327 RepID=A0ABT1RPK7_9FIRM|nr:hypothetical protein [Anaerovorax odorimutans]MCQ4637130.1 hypothetical protein [Anaerovorax odorimutans]